MSEPRHLPPAIASFIRWRFWMAAGLLALAALMFLETGSRSSLQTAQWLFCLSVSFVVTATVAWEWKALGNPSILSNAVLHVLVFAALACMLLRLRGHVGESDWSLLGAVADVLDWGNKALGFFPPVLFELLRSPAVAFLFLGVCLALCFRPAWALGILASVFVFGLTLSLLSDGFGSRGWFFGGMACFVLSLRIQYAPPDHRHFWENVKTRWSGDQHVRGDLELKQRVLQLMISEGRPLTETECLARVARGLGKSSHDETARACTTRVVGQLVREDRICQLVHGSSGPILGLAVGVGDSSPDVFSRISMVPKLAVAGMIALVWIISPIDLIPDTTPVIGALDDVAAALVVAGMAFRSRSRRRFFNAQQLDSDSLFKP